jgi:hypothetical protein
MSRYELDEAYVRKFRSEIEKGSTLAIQIRDGQDYSWKNVKAILSKTPLEGGEPLRVTNTVSGQRPTGETIYMKIVEELPDDVLLPSIQGILNWW